MVQLVTSLMFCLAAWTMAVPVDELTRTVGTSTSSLQCALTALDGVVKGERHETNSGKSLPSLSELLNRLEPKDGKKSSGNTGQNPAASPGEAAGFKPHTSLGTSFSDPSQSSVGALGSAAAKAATGTAPDGSLNKGNPHVNIKLAAKAVS